VSFVAPGPAKHVICIPKGACGAKSRVLESCVLTSRSVQRVWGRGGLGGGRYNGSGAAVIIVAVGAIGAGAALVTVAVGTIGAVCDCVTEPVLGAPPRTETCSGMHVHAHI